MHLGTIAANLWKIQMDFSSSKETKDISEGSLILQHISIF